MAKLFSSSWEIFGSRVKEAQPNLITLQVTLIVRTITSGRPGTIAEARSVLRTTQRSSTRGTRRPRQRQNTQNRQDCQVTRNWGPATIRKGLMKRIGARVSYIVYVGVLHQRALVSAMTTLCFAQCLPMWYARNSRHMVCLSAYLCIMLGGEDVGVLYLF